MNNNQEIRGDNELESNYSVAESESKKTINENVIVGNDLHRQADDKSDDMLLKNNGDEHE